MDNHKFWNTQPIDISKNAQSAHMIVNYKVEEVSKVPIPLPEGFEWVVIDITKDDELDMVYEFLLNYYNNDPNVSRRFHYQKDFLRWFLTPPGYYPDLLLGIKYNNKLLATIFGIPMKIKIFDKVINTGEVNFLCVHHSLRNKRLAPVMIKEITRRFFLHEWFHAFYTAVIDLPNTLMKTCYYHRPLNVPKLVDIGFIEKPERISMQGFSKLFKTLEAPTINIRKIEPKDFKVCCKLLNEYHQQFNVAILFDQERFDEHFAFRENIIETYVVENDGKVTDMLSYYFIPSKLSNETRHTELKKAYVYYYFNTVTDLERLMDNGLYLMKKKNIDMVNAMKQYNNYKFFDKLKFKEGTGELNFYFYNWSCPTVNYNDMAIIMV